jgi:predicted nucleotidyltransferase
MESDRITICLSVLIGSKAYNFATETSDTDIRGFGMQKRIFSILGLDKPFTMKSLEPDLTIWDISDFTRLALRCNTSALDVLFAEDFNVLECNDVGKLYREYRKQFLSTHALHNVIKGYALSEYDIATGKKKSGNMGAKRRLQVEQFGYSPKNAHHACRLLYAGCHALQTGEFRTYWEKGWNEWNILMGLKEGKFTVDEFQRFHEEALRTFEWWSQNSVLSQEPDLEFINELLCYAVGREVVKEFPNLRFAKK